MTRCQSGLHFVYIHLFYELFYFIYLLYFHYNTIYLFYIQIYRQINPWKKTKSMSDWVLLKKIEIKTDFFSFDIKGHDFL